MGGARLEMSENKDVTRNLLGDEKSTHSKDSQGKYKPELILSWGLVVVFIMLALIAAFNWLGWHIQIGTEEVGSGETKPLLFDLGRIGAVASIASLFGAAVIAIWSVRLQRQAELTSKKADELQEYIYRTWPGSQTDYGAGFPNTRVHAPMEVQRHIEDIAKGFVVDETTNLDVSGFMLSSIAYGIEHSPQTLKRFVDVLEKSIGHKLFFRNAPTREVKIAIWPEPEHQMIWGADRQRLLGDDVWKENEKPAPLRAMLEDDEHRKAWLDETPAWCSNVKRFWQTVQQLQRIGTIFDTARGREKFISLHVNEIEPWSGRAFYNRHGDGETYSLLIITTPVNARILSANHWTTMGFHSESKYSYRQLEHIYNTCTRGRQEYSEEITSEPVSNRTSEFKLKPFDAIGRYFLLPEGWGTWDKNAAEAWFAKKLGATVDREATDTEVAPKGT